MSKYLLIMALPMIVWYSVFVYAPMYGIQLAFKDFKILQGIGGSPWVGFKHFAYMFNSSPDFPRILRNTIIISLYKLVFGFPAPIILALLFNEVRNTLFKRLTQSVSYFPHFLSWVTMSGLLVVVLSPSNGIVGGLFQWLGMKPIYFLGDPQWFRFSLVVSNIWKEVGWGTIVYLAALSGVNPDLYEAASIDGAGRWKQTIHITLPSIAYVVAFMLIFSTGSILNAGFDQIFNLYHPNVYSVADIIDTYVYRIGLVQLQYSFSAAVGLFQNAVGLIMVLTTNYIVRKMGQPGIF